MLSALSFHRFGRLAVVCLGLSAGCGGEQQHDLGVASAALLSSADCPAGYNVIQGNSSNNTLNGTAGSDCILGLGGNDTINGLGGNDFLVGGAGTDIIYGNFGNDTIYGEDGNDDLNGDDGNDTVYGGIGTDYVGGNAGNDRLFGEAGIDQVYGDEDNDILSGGDANDQCYGGTGHDVVAGGAGTDTLQGNDGDDAIVDTGSNTINGGNGTDRCTGTSCEVAAPVASGCTQASQCAASQTCVADVGTCLPCGTVGGVGCNDPDGCPSDPNKTAPGICGCGVADTDSDGDGTANCNDACPNNAPKIAPGVCGCAVADTDSDSDGTPNCNDACANDATKIAAGICGCGVADTDSDADGTANCNDACASDPAKVAAGVCGCGVADTDSDADGTANCNDACASDPAKIAAGVCGCGVADTDSDADGTANCNDACASDPAKIAAGVCGCGVADTDSDADGTANCNDGCPSDAAKIAAGICGCGNADTDSDADGIANCNDACPGSNDAIDANSNGIPDGCDECLVNADCHSGNECTTATCVSGECSYPPVPPIVATVTNGTFSTGTLTGFTTFVTPLGYVEAAVESFDTDGDGQSSPAARLRAGWTSVGANRGGGLRQYVTVFDGSISVSANVATFATVSNADGGTYTLTINGYVLDSYAVGSVTANQTYRRTLQGSVPVEVMAGSYDVQILVTRNGLSGATISSYIDDIAISGGASQRAVECASGTGRCDETGTCGPCADNDGDGTCNEYDACRNDPAKVAPGGCGCGTADTDTDGDSVEDCFDLCASDSNKFGPGACGCGISDSDFDADGWPDCVDECPSDPVKIEAGTCGCGWPDEDNDQDGTFDCNDLCWGHVDWADADQDGIPDGCDGPDGECNGNSTGPGVQLHDVYVRGAVAPSDYSFLRGVQCIVGDVYVENTNVTDLMMFATVRGIAGDVIIDGNAQLTSVDGFENVSRIGGSLMVVHNPALANLEGLLSLDDLAGSAWMRPLSIYNNAELPACWVDELEDLTSIPCAMPTGIGAPVACAGNNGVGVCPSSIPCVPGATGPGIYDGDAIINNESALASFAGVRCITGAVGIYDTDLTNLDALTSLRAIGGDLFIYQNDQLENVDGLNSLVSIGTWLDIELNPVLQDLEGLSNLEALGEADPMDGGVLIVGANAQLPGCWRWMLERQTGLACTSQYCGGNTGTGSCGELPEGFVCEPGANGPGVYDDSLHLHGTGVSELLHELGGLTCITGSFTIYSTDLIDLSSFASLEMIGGDLVISQNNSLQSVDGLEALTSIGDRLSIEYNPALRNLEGLSSLSAVGSPGLSNPLRIFANQSLPACWSWLIGDQTGTGCYHQSLAGDPYNCAYNSGTGSCGELPPNFVCAPGASGPGVYDSSLLLLGNGSAEGLSYFGGIACVTGDLLVHETDLEDLSGLAVLEQVGGQLSIFGNAFLTSVDGLESLTSSGSLSVRDNASLLDLAGLVSLESIGPVEGPTGMPLVIAGNESMPACWAELVAAQVDTTCEPEPGISNDCSGNSSGGSCD